MDTTVFAEEDAMTVFPPVLRRKRERTVQVDCEGCGVIREVDVYPWGSAAICVSPDCEVFFLVPAYEDSGLDVSQVRDESLAQGFAESDKERIESRSV